VGAGTVMGEVGATAETGGANNSPVGRRYVGSATSGVEEADRAAGAAGAAGAGSEAAGAGACGREAGDEAEKKAAPADVMPAPARTGAGAEAAVLAAFQGCRAAGRAEAEAVGMDGVWSSSEMLLRRA